MDNNIIKIKNDFRNSVINSVRERLDKKKYDNISAKLVEDFLRKLEDYFGVNNWLNGDQLVEWICTAAISQFKE